MDMRQSPKSELCTDVFASGGRDGSVRVWDLRVAHTSNREGGLIAYNFFACGARSIVSYFAIRVISAAVAEHHECALPTER